jgi:hypothetical protein
MKKILLLMAVFFVAGMTAFSQVKVTFSVDMSIYWKGGTFSPATDTVRLAGDMFNWNSQVDLVKGTGADSGKYTVQVSGVAAGTAHYKFLYTSPKGLVWEDDQATSSKNREATIGTTDLVLPTVLFNNVTGKVNHVKFSVDMSVPIKTGKDTIGVDKVFLAGDFTNWGSGAILLTKGATDSVYSAWVDSLKSGSTHSFKFVYASDSASHGAWEDDPNRTYFVPEKDSTSFLDYWNRQNPNVQLGNGDVNFTLDMSVMINAGIFNNTKDSVFIAGKFNSWNTTTPEFLNKDIVNPKTYFITHSFVQEPFGNEPYKYNVKKHTTGPDSVWIDGYERPVNWGGNNRETLFLGTNKDTTDWYDGVHPDWAFPNGTNMQVTFNVDMTPAMDAVLQGPGFFDPAKDTLYWSSGEPAFAATQHWYRPSGGHIKNVKLSRVGSTNIYTVTFTVIEPSFNAFEYSYEYQKADSSWQSEPGGLGIDFIYRVRYVGQDVANHFPKNPWTMPTDAWTNKPVKTDQEKDPYKSLVGIKNENINPISYSLLQNYPNPFNPSTTIKFSIQKDNLVTLKIYNLLGQEVATLVNTELKAGLHTYNFNASRLSTGVYFYTIKSGSFNQTKKMLLLK